MTERLGLAGPGAVGAAAVWNRVMSPQAARVRAAHSAMGAAQSQRLILFSRRPAQSTTTTTLLSVQRANSRPRAQFAPPEVLQFVAHHAPQRSPEHESADFRET